MTPSIMRAPSRSIIATIDISPFFQSLVVRNPDPGQLVLSMLRGARSLEFGQIGNHVEIQRGPRKPQHFSGKVARAAIVQMAHQAHAPEASQYGVGGRAADDIGAGEVAR